MRYNWKAARGHLCDACTPFAAHIGRLGADRIRVRDDGDLFQSLARSIAFQQLSGKAAGTIHGRFEALFRNHAPSPEATLTLGEEKLRSVGLSRAKSLAILDLAQKCTDGVLPTPRTLRALSDDDVIERLVSVRGIGPWTAQMHLIFHLGRPDVMPDTDLGVQNGIQAVYKLEKRPTPAEAMARTAHLAPYRSAAAWYFWRVADTVVPG